MKLGVFESGRRLRDVQLGVLMGMEKWVWSELGFWREGNGGKKCRESILFVSSLSMLYAFNLQILSFGPSGYSYAVKFQYCPFSFGGFQLDPVKFSITRLSVKS